jgi:toxin CcdB
MGQFDVYENPNPRTKATIPYLLEVQSDLLQPLCTRVVVPLVTASATGRAITRLNPEFQVLSVPVFMSTAELAGIPIRALGKKVGSLKEERHRIMGALDFLFTGF